MGFTYGHQYTQEQVTFIIKKYKTVTTKELHAEFNERFKANVTLSSIANKISHLKLMERNLQSNYGKYSLEMLEWLKKHYNAGITLDNLTDQFNKRFNATFTKSALWHKMNRICDKQVVRTTREIIPRVKYTKEMCAWIKENYALKPYNMLSLDFNERFNEKITPSALEHKITRLGLTKTKEAIKKQGRKHNVGCFQKGHLPPRWVPVGTEVLKQGFTWVKIKEPNVWKAKHRLIYEQAHGKISPGTLIAFINGNKSDMRLENLVAIPQSEWAIFTNLTLDPGGCDEIGKIKLVMFKLRKKMLKKGRK